MEFSCLESKEVTWSNESPHSDESTTQADETVEDSRAASESQEADANLAPNSDGCDKTENSALAAEVRAFHGGSIPVSAIE